MTSTQNSNDLAYMPRRMPSYLAEKIQQLGSHIVGERRNVTVVFSDISGFTSMAEQRDPEEVAAIAKICHTMLGRIVYEYEGVVDKIVGDGLMAIFGIPTRENDPERAILAAIEMQQVMQGFFQELQKSMGTSLGLSIGINTGLVIIGDLGNEFLMDYTVIGDVVNTASRVEERAASGEILITYDTYQRTAHSFDFQPLEPVQLRGKSQPLRLYRVIGKKEKPLSSRGIKGLNSPIIGRDEELAKCKDIVDRLINGEGGTLLIAGEAGVGKSRLVAELKEYAKTQEAISIEGKCLPYSRSINYFVFVDALRSYFHLESSDDPTEMMGKIEASLRSNGVAESTILNMDSLLSPQLQRELDSGLQNESDKKIQIFSAVEDVFASAARSKPLMIVLDDLHWADELSIELLISLINNLWNSRIIFVCVYRPSLPDEQNDSPAYKLEGEQFHNAVNPKVKYVRIALSPLSGEASSDLLESLLTTEELPLDMKELILGKAAGNPFYLEEVIRSVIDDKAIEKRDGKWLAVKELEDIKVPGSVQDVIMARLDRLDEESKNVLRCASIVGRSFDYDLLLYLITGGIESITPEILQDLESDLLGKLSQSALKYQKSRSIHRTYDQILNKNIEKLVEMGFISPEEDQGYSFGFRHALIQDVAYNSILIKRRRQLHELVGKYLEEKYSNRLDEFLDTIAYHYSNSNNKDSAISYLIEAGRKSMKSFSGSAQGALRYFQQADEILDNVTIKRDDKAVYGKKISIGKGEAYNDLGQAEEALVCFEKVLDLSEKTEDFTGMAEVLRQIANNKAQMGDWDAGLKAYQQSLNIAKDLGDLPQMGFVYNAIGYGYFVKGEYDEAMKYFQEALRIGKQANDHSLMGDASNCLGMIDSVRGELDKAIQHYHDSLISYKDLGESHYEAQAYQNLGIAHFKKGEMELADKYYDDSLKISEKCGYARLKAYTYLNKAELYLSLSSPEKATEICELAFHILHTLNDGPALAEGYKLYGKIYKSQRLLKPAEEAFLTSLKISAESSSITNLAEVNYEIGMMYKDEGMTQKALQYLNESKRIFEELGMTDEVQKIEL